jgi:hypothetical protein
VISEAYREEAKKISSVSEWHKWFKVSSHVKLQIKTMLITSLNIKGTVHFEVIPQGQIVNQAYYMK